MVETGSRVRNVAAGDYVSAESHITCGACFQLPHRPRRTCASAREILGVDRDGAFARYVAVPESVIWQNDRTKLPPEIATLQEPFGNAVFATTEQDLAGRSVAVLGCGPIGLFTIAIARASGAASVARGRPHPVPARSRGEDGRERTVNVDETPDAPAGSSSQNEGLGSTSSSRCPARRGRSPTRSASPATAAA